MLRASGRIGRKTLLFLKKKKQKDFIDLEARQLHGCGPESEEFLGFSFKKMLCILAALLPPFYQPKVFLNKRFKNLVDWNCIIQASQTQNQ